MPYSMSQASLPVFEIGLTALSGVLDKAASFASVKKIEPSVLLQSRLSPDMFALTRQVQIACDLAKNGSARLAGVEAPRFEDNEATIDELKARIAKTLAFIASIDPAKVNGAETREILLQFPSRTLKFTGTTYLMTFVLPNLYFHISAVYSILRSNGVDIGKNDYLGKIQ